MRYALFVPWIYQTLFEEGSSGRAQDNVQKAEIRLAGRLKHGAVRSVASIIRVRRANLPR
jgi:hypothetical protein